MGRQMWMGCQPVPRHLHAQSIKPDMAHMNKAAAANILAALEPISAQ